MNEYLPADLILKKKRGGQHTPAELKFLVQGFAQGKIPDYQMSAWLMAVCFASLNEQEVAIFTDEMKNSGQVLDFSSLGLTVDKHSTGGLGDKTSLILAPLVAAAGVPVPMIAGRGLGHTGGTLDKLESIPGFSVNLSLVQFQKQVRELGTSIIGQTSDICPADKKLYALRDVTGTVDSLPLICGSIMSKKLAEGISGLVLDVKFGSGAFMKTQEEAIRLASALSGIGARAGKKVVALVTRMSEPLGRFIGNALEVQECLDIMNGQTKPSSGKDYSDTIELTLELAAHMIHLGGKARSAEEGRSQAEELLRSGAAREFFDKLLVAQGAQTKFTLPKARHQLDITASGGGHMKFDNLEKLGLASIILGAGRIHQTDPLDPAAGIEVLVRDGEAVQKSTPLLRLHANDKEKFAAAQKMIAESFSIQSQPHIPSPLIAKVLT